MLQLDGCPLVRQCCTVITPSYCGTELRSDVYAGTTSGHMSLRSVVPSLTVMADYGRECNYCHNRQAHISQAEIYGLCRFGLSLCSETSDYY